MKKTLVFLFVLCTSLTLLAFVNQVPDKVAIHGQVVDKLTGEPLAGACITTAGSSRAVYTDFDGNFTLEQAAGSTLNISLISYEAAQVQANSSKLVVELGR